MAATPTASTAISVRETGYAQGSSWWDQTWAESTPELVWPLSVQVYDRMRRQDAQVASVLRAVTLPVRRTRWWLDGSGCDERVVQLVSEDLGLPVKGVSDVPPAAGRGRSRFSWSEHLRMALISLPIGHMFFEQVYRIDDAGLARLRKLGPRMPRTIAKIDVESDGGLKSITQHAPTWTTGATKPPQPIPVSRLVAYVNEREGGDWRGQSLLRAAYKDWLLKDRMLRVQAQTIERNGLGVPLYTGAENEEDLSAGRKLAEQYRSGETAGAAVPHGATLKAQGVEGELPDAEKVIRYYDEQIARAVLAHFLNLGTQTGSWALGSTFADFFTLSLQAVGEDVATTATHHVVEDLVDVNFGEDEPAPRIVFDEIGGQAAAVARAVEMLVASGVIRPDRDLEEFMRTALGLPPKGLTGQPGDPPRSPADEDAA